MRLIRHLFKNTGKQQGHVLTIGNFDGLHRGHQAVITELKKIANIKQLPSVLMTFEPHPKEFFQKEKAIPRLSNLREKCKIIETLGIDKLVILKFNEAFSLLSADDFIKKLLVDSLNVRYLLIGEDFRFGHERQGDTALLQRYANAFQFELQVFSNVVDENSRISSSRIRQCLAVSDFKQAENLLGYEYFIEGRVRHGDERGRVLGFPTVNIALKRLNSPLRGVFAVTVAGLSEKMLKGVANLGVRPTVGGLKTLLEVHLFDFNEMVYGQHVRVYFKHKIRDEMKFTSFDELKKQIQQDKINCVAVLSNEVSCAKGKGHCV